MLLDAGHYEFSSRARTLGLAKNATNSGVFLRISGDRSSSGLLINPDWKLLRYDFDIGAQMSVELVCEFRGANATGMFDASAIKLRRTESPAPSPPP